MTQTYIHPKFKFNEGHWSVSNIHHMLLNTALFLEKFENVKVDKIGIVRGDYTGWTIVATENYKIVSTQHNHLKGQVYFENSEALIEYLEGIKTVLVSLKVYQWK